MARAHPSPRAIAPEPAAPELASEPAASEPAISVPPRTSHELLASAGVATFLEDQALLEGAVDADAVERWLRRPPRSVYFYSEEPIEVMDGSIHGRCQRVRHRNTIVINEYSVILRQHRRTRVMLSLSHAVDFEEQARERGEWVREGGNRLPGAVVAWDDAHIRYAAGAVRYEVACVPTLRTVSCDDYLLGPRAYCLDHAPVVRPWRAPFVPHVGPVSPAYHDPIPALPASSCSVECEPSDCAAALRLANFPQAPLYSEDDAALAVFRDLRACRDFAIQRSRRDTLRSTP